MRDKPNEKIRDITRSILPSKHRKTASDDKRHMHRGARRRSRQQLEWMEDLQTEDFQDSDEGLFFTSEDDLLDKANELRPETHTIVRNRRDADKLQPFIRWAKANSQHLKSDVDKYHHIKGKIGSSTIKDHALGHFVNLSIAQNPFIYKSILGDKKYKRLTPWETEEQLSNWLMQAFELDHAGLNRIIKHESIAFETCEDASRNCWQNQPTGDARKHNDTICTFGGLLNCLSHTEIELRSKNCWQMPIARMHQPRLCKYSRNHMISLNDVPIVVQHFFKKYSYQEMEFSEKALADFLRNKGIYS